MGWRERAACQDLDVELWFPNESTPDPKIPRARQVCAACPVWEPCLEYALKNPTIAKGIYGGLLERERKNLARHAHRHPDPLVRERAGYGLDYQGLAAPADDSTLIAEFRERWPSRQIPLVER